MIVLEQNNKMRNRHVNKVDKVKKTNTYCSPCSLATLGHEIDAHRQIQTDKKTRQNIEAEQSKLRSPTHKAEIGRQATSEAIGNDKPKDKAERTSKCRKERPSGSKARKAEIN